MLKVTTGRTPGQLWNAAPLVGAPGGGTLVTTRNHATGQVETSGAGSIQLDTVNTWYRFELSWAVANYETSQAVVFPATDDVVWSLNGSGAGTATLDVGVVGNAAVAVYAKATSTRALGDLTQTVSNIVYGYGVESNVAPTISNITVTDRTLVGGTFTFVAADANGDDVTVKYQIIARDAALGSWASAPTATSPQNFSGLSHSTAYDLVLQADDGTLQTVSSRVQFSTQTQAAPSVSTAAGSDYIDIWADQSVYTGDSLTSMKYICKTSGTTPAEGDWATATAMVLTGHLVGNSYIDVDARAGSLSPATTHYVWVRSITATGITTTSARITQATSAVTQPTFTALPSISAPTSQGFTVSWTAANADRVYVGVRTADSTTYADWNWVLATSGVVITGLAQNTTYHVRVKLEQDAGAYTGANGVFSNASGSSQGALTGSALTQLTATLAIAGSLSTRGAAAGVLLDWEDATGGVNDYDLEYGTTVAYGAHVYPATSTYLMTVAYGTLYYFRVRARDTAGNASGWLTASATGGFIFDFEDGSDAQALGSPVWTVFGSPQNTEYDTAQYKNGAKSGWVKGPSSAAYGGAVADFAAMSGNSGEVRFWIRHDTANENRVAQGGVGSDPEVFELRFKSTGALSIYTKKAGNPNGYTTNAYTDIDTYAAGWMQYRLLFVFTNQTYQLSRRASVGDSWTQLKASGAADYNIPMRGDTTQTELSIIRFNGYSGSNLWLDDLQAAGAGIA